MRHQEVVFVFLLASSNQLGHPFELLLASGHPQEVDTLAAELGVDARPKRNVLDDRREGCDADSAAHQHRDIILEPVLVALAERTVKIDLREGATVQIVGIIGLADVLGEGAHGTNVERQCVLVRCRGDRKRVVLVVVQLEARNPNPLSALVVKIRWLLKLQVRHLGGVQRCLDHRYLDPLAAGRYQLVDGEQALQVAMITIISMISRHCQHHTYHGQKEVEVEDGRLDELA